ncbi:MAG: selenium cofactor biosynthesis protein YqeC [Deltaproteobacteria bacterium]|nr:selenium cofactor biosynthesis protein YqeC [Deltaproteobacteria bacterium]
MYHFQRRESLCSLFNQYKFVTVIGAGGKTSLIELLAHDFKEKGLSVAITTTTKIYAKDPYVLEDSLRYDLLRSRPFIRVGKEIVNGKLHGISEETLVSLGNFYDLILIEGDGAKGKPLKCPTDYEPVVPSVTDIVVLVCGLDAINKTVEDSVFRWELLREKGIDGGEKIDEKRFVELLCGYMLKGINDKQYAICFNKYDMWKNKRSITSLISLLTDSKKPEFILVSSILFRSFYICTEL